MESSFDFLSNSNELKNIYNTTIRTEKLYTLGLFSEELINIRKIAEQIVLLVLNQENVRISRTNTFAMNLKYLKQCSIDHRIIDSFYELKGLGNLTAHTMQDISKDEGSLALEKIHRILYWYVQKYSNIAIEYVPYRVPKGKDSIYQTAEKKLIYIQTADNSKRQWPQYDGLEKIGDASITSFEIDGRPNSSDLRKIADARINQYMRTAGVPHILQWAELAYRKTDNTWFRDYDVHAVLNRSHVKKTKLTEGNEWYQTDLETAKSAITAVKEGKNAIDANQTTSNAGIKLRPEQKDAIAKTRKVFRTKDRMLWNAKMRFGKTISTLQLIKEEKFPHVLIITHRPIVNDSWYDDFKKMNMAKEGYVYGSKQNGEKLEKMVQLNTPFIYFASLQDLRGSKSFGGVVADKNELVAEIEWDLVVIDEAHEGTQTELAQQVITGVVKKGRTKLLELSGTPFNLLDNYEEDQVYTWDYVMEQQAKVNWEEKHPGEKNPYEGLPKVNMFTFEIRNQFKDNRFIDIDGKSFNFREFFKINDDGKFVYESKVRQFLDNITQPSEKTHYPFSTKEFRNELRHTLWLLPSINAAKALKALMEQHPVFGMEYKIVNAVDNGDTDGDASEDDLQRVRKAITDDPSATKTITLTVRKLTTGINVKEWTAVIFLSNTNSSMQYLQAAFRAQTPFSHEKLGMKTNCYIFDFAPDRALTVMADSSRLHTGVGKRISKEQKQEMGTLLNFLPIIGEFGNGMKEYKVDEMLTQLKKAYAEKAVRAGFDDDSLYNDALLMLRETDLNDFNKLKAVVGTTQAERRPMQINVNEQGLSEEEYENAEKGKRKQLNDRSPEEKAAIEKMKALKRQRKIMISILRSISIRLPLMIYGLDVKFEDDITIQDFVERVDAQSWNEFMPKGVTKELFLKFKKYYDSEVFIEAGHIIRRKVKELDREDPLERTRVLAEIFGTFRNPDKETVLTPWRVVNLHFGKTFGGLAFYDEEYRHTTKQGVDAQHWIQTDLTDQVFYDKTHILEINSKTGLYPLYATTSLYYLRFQQLNEETAGKFDLHDEQRIWADILKHNIFIIAKTPMAKWITKRTLVGYHEYDVNIAYIDNLINYLDNRMNDGVKLMKGAFGKKVKFDVVIGNPPYQMQTKGTRTSDKSIYHLFMEASFKLADKVSLITPARFLFNAGDTPCSFNNDILHNKHFQVVMFEPNSSKIFPRTDIKGGVAITLYNKSKIFEAIELFIPNAKLKGIVDKVIHSKNYEPLSNIIFTSNKLNLLALYKDYPGAKSFISSNGRERRLQSNIFDKLSIFTEKKISVHDITVYGVKKNNRVIRYTNNKFIDKESENLDKWKVILPKSIGNGVFGETLSQPIILGPQEAYTYTFIGIGNFESQVEATNAFKYVKTKFARAMLNVLKVTQDNTPAKWEKVPLQDFTERSDIKWGTSIMEIDNQLYKKYKLNQEEIDFIESKVQVME